MFRKIVIGLTAALALIVAGLFLYIVAGPGQSGYSVAARTETVTVRVTDPQGIAAVLPIVDVADPALPGAMRSLSGATLEAPAGTEIVARRKRDGTVFLRIDTEAAAKGEHALLRDADGVETELPVQAMLPVSLIRPGATPDAPARTDTLLIAFRGAVQIGDDVAPMVEATLLEGKVSIVERGALFGERYVVREAELDPGDRVVWHAAGEVAAEVSGFIQAGYGEGLAVTAHGAADSLEIIRLGVQSFRFQPLPWDRIASNPLANLTAVVVGVLATFAGFVQAIGKLVARRRDGED